jgi:uncharacterized protein (TIGR02452 family)
MSRKQSYKIRKYDKIRESNVRVFEHTLEVSQKVYPFQGISYVVTEDQLPEILENAATKQGILCGTRDEDCIVTLQNLVKEGKQAGLINMACPHKPGGGVTTGASAQEEQLCRCSNLYSALKNVTYPIKEFSCIVSTQVEFFKDEYYDSCKPFSSTVLSVAAYKLTDPKHFDDKCREGTVKKIRILLASAIKAGCTDLILSALGCGAYKVDTKSFYNLFRIPRMLWQNCLIRF